MHVGVWLGAWPTVFIVVVTAWLGAKNVKQQGLTTLNSVQTKMAQGQMPSDEIVAGLLLLVAGVLLVTPGFVTDIFGLSLLVPAVRQVLIKSVQQHIVTNKVAGGGFTYQSHQHSQSPFSDADNDFQQNADLSSPPHHQGKTLDGEYERKD